MTGTISRQTYGLGVDDRRVRPLDRRRQLAHRAADGCRSVRNLETEIMRGRESRPSRRAPHPDHIAAAASLEDTLSRALGIGVQARPHRSGYQLLLDQAGSGTACAIGRPTALRR